MYMWGNRILNIYRYTYNPPHAEAKRAVIDIIPSPDNSDPSDNPAGRQRRPRSMSGFTKFRLSGPTQ